MKYLNTYKLFEAYLESPAFYRFSHVDLLNGKEEVEFKPSERKMIGPDFFNDALVKFGFPDKRRCVHFMDKVAFDPSMSFLYGKNKYRIKVDESSKVGWSFYSPINDWFYKSNSFFYRLRNSEFVSNVDPKFLELNYLDNEGNVDEKAIDEMVEILTKSGIIGFGKVSDIESSKFCGKLPLFAWTEDVVNVSHKEEEVKKNKEYVNKPLLDEEDFIQLGLSKQDIPLFFKENGGNLNRMNNVLKQKGWDFEKIKIEAIGLLKKWKDEKN
jgi:hypothetical protein